MKTLTDQELSAVIFLNKLMTTNASWPIELNGHLRPGQVLESVLNNPVFIQSETFQKIHKTFKPERELEICRKEGIQLLTCFDTDYPESLKNIPLAPPLLYVRGNFEALNQPAVAVVGSRQASLYGLQQARKFGEKLAESNFAVVSGLAKGIDQAAHEGCLRVNQGMTVAVLGCGLDRIYPRGSEKLYQRICERGAVISEYPLATPPLAYHFPRRNRIISGLSLGVLVVEAHIRSGSLITAYTALEQGKEVFAVPGPVDRLTSQGTHRLIKEGAVLTENVEDILAGLNYHLPGQMPVEFQPHKGHRPQADCDDDFLSENNQKPADDQPMPQDWLYQHLEHKACSFDELVASGAGAPGVLAASLLELELNHKIQREPDGRYRLK